jgi:aldehyde dehydrogenase (NAD+)
MPEDYLSSINTGEIQMHIVDQIYIDGEFVTPHGKELFELHNPATAQVIGTVRLGDVEDAQRAIAAAKRAFKSFSQSTVTERIELLHRLNKAVVARVDDITAAMTLEYGAPQNFAPWAAAHAAQVFLDAARTLETYEFTRRIGKAEVLMEPVGVAAMITPWNSNAGFICSKFAAALSAGCTVVIKPSEMSAIQTQIVMEALHSANLPKGLLNIVNGRGDVVGQEFSTHRDVAKVSFTGSTVVGKTIMRNATETLKRVTLELGGKSPTVILADADLETAVPMAIAAGFMNSGQACIAGTRILVPEDKLDEVNRLAIAAVAAFKAGDPNDPATKIGPMVSQKQWERVQRYIRIGMESEAVLLAGGEGKPEGLDGYFVKPTVFTNVTNDMVIAREEIFGPVLSILTYRTEQEAIEIANDTDYGLQAVVLGKDHDHACEVASQLQAGRVLVNGLTHEPLAPFGGFKQSGIGREFGTFGLEAYLEPKSVLGAFAA